MDSYILYIPSYSYNNYVHYIRKYVHQDCIVGSCKVRKHVPFQAYMTATFRYLQANKAAESAVDN